MIPDNCSARDAQKSAANILLQAGIEDAALDARLLLAGVMEIEMSRLISIGADIVEPTVINRYRDMISERAKGKPVHRILGYREFFGRRFDIGTQSLEPRPETELLVECVLNDHKQSTNASFAEIGVGSGAIIVTLLCEMDQACGLGTDISSGALGDTLANAKQHEVDNQISLVETDCLEGIEEQFDFIVSNPPYIPRKEIGMLSTEVRMHDPLAALDGGIDGLEIYRRLLQTVGRNLKPEGRLYLETGHNQHEAIEAIGDQMGWGIVAKHLDLSRLERIVVLQSK